MLSQESLLGKYLSRPHETALLVIDAQDGYVNPEATLPKLVGATTNDLQAMIPRLGGFIKAARGVGIRVFWTQMAEDPKLMAENMRELMLAYDTPMLITPGHPSYDFIGISPEPGDSIIHKVHYNAFTDTDLEQQLIDGGIDTLMLTGAYASRCLAATAFMASDALGFRLIVLKDLVAGDDTMRQETRSFLNVTKTILGEVATSKQIMTAWKKLKK